MFLAMNGIEPHLNKVINTIWYINKKIKKQIERVQMFKSIVRLDLNNEYEVKRTIQSA